MNEDIESPNFHALDAILAAASDIKLPTNLQKEHMNSFLIAEAEAKAQAAKIREMHAAKLAPVEPATMSKRQPDIPFSGDRCAVNKCHGFSQGGYVTVSPKDVWRDPVMNPEPVSDDWEEEAFRQHEEAKLRALGHSASLIDQIENAQRFMGAAPVAHQMISAVTLPLCRFHSEHPDITRSAGFKAGALPLRFGHQ